MAMLDYGTQADILKGNLLGYKGAIFENLMADFLCKSGQNYATSIRIAVLNWTSW